MAERCGLLSMLVLIMRSFKKICLMVITMVYVLTACVCMFEPGCCHNHASDDPTGEQNPSVVRHSRIQQAACTISWGAFAGHVIRPISGHCDHNPGPKGLALPTSSFFRHSVDSRNSVSPCRLLLTQLSNSRVTATSSHISLYWERSSTLITCSPSIPSTVLLI